MPSVTSANPGSDITTKSGITTNSTGERHIPASLRADGSTRKEIKIRPGYKPPEDVEVYKNRTAEGFKTKPSSVPGAAALKEDEGESVGAAASKNAKRRDARRRAKEKAGADGVEKEEENSEGGTNGQTKVADEPVKVSGMPNLNTAVVAAPQSRLEASPKARAQADRDKQARKLKKKLREAKELQEKKERGEGLLHEQFEKIIKINELIRELDNLGFDANGEPNSD